MLTKTENEKKLDELFQTIQNFKNFGNLHNADKIYKDFDDIDIMLKSNAIECKILTIMEKQLTLKNFFLNSLTPVESYWIWTSESDAYKGERVQNTERIISLLKRDNKHKECLQSLTDDTILLFFAAICVAFVIFYISAIICSTLLSPWLLIAIPIISSIPYLYKEIISLPLAEKEEIVKAIEIKKVEIYYALNSDNKNDSFVKLLNDPYVSDDEIKVLEAYDRITGKQLNKRENNSPFTAKDIAQTWLASCNNKALLTKYEAQSLC
jgi:hypothetical protein